MPRIHLEHVNHRARNSTSGIHVRGRQGDEDDVVAGNEPIVDVEVCLADLAAHEDVHAEPQRLYPY